VLRSNLSRVALLSAAALLACHRGESAATHDSAANAKPDVATQPAAPRVVDVTATEFAFRMPDTIPAGVTTFKLTDAGQQLHHMQLIKLEDGKTLADLAAALKKPGPLPSWAIESGGPNPPRPGGGVSELTQMVEPGNYAVVCFVPGPDGLPHLAKGMAKPLTVVASDAPAAPAPEADVTVTLADYGFHTSQPLTAGKHTIKIHNAGPQDHELILLKLAPGKSVQDVAKWIDHMQGPPPAEPLGGVAGIHTGQDVYLTVDLAPGEYGFLCEVPDAKDGKPHAAHGMMSQFKI
jgi:hypothetical protein